MDLLKASVIDLGSNTAKLANYDIGPDGGFEEYGHKSIMTKLGEDLSQTGFLGDGPMARSMLALKGFRDLVDSESIAHVVPIATSAVREAANGISFLREVYGETGFRFRILSEREEATYSYFGAARALRIPSMLFFDLGGGSLEIVYARNFAVQSVMSLPLGALRLTQMYSDRPDGSFSEDAAGRMRRRILDLIPSRRELDMGRDTVLVGAGGTVRNIAKIHQSNTNYPLVKLHNYRMDRRLVGSISAMLHDAPPVQIAKIERINAGRAETMAAGSCAIDLLMENLEFESIVASAHALREGALGASLEFCKEYAEGTGIPDRMLESSVRAASEPDALPDYLGTLLALLITRKGLDSGVPRMLPHALRRLRTIPGSADPDNLLESVPKGDSHLGHREQMISEMAAIMYRDRGGAIRLYDSLGDLFRPGDKKTIKRMSLLLALAAMLDGSQVSVSTDEISGTASFRIVPAGSFQRDAFHGTIQRISARLDIEIGYEVVNRTGSQKKRTCAP